MERVLGACAGFLLAVLWMDLMFDVQALAYPGGEPLPEAVLASIAAYYRRVTTDAGMSVLVALVMFTTVAGAAWQAWRGAGPSWVRWAALALCTAPIALAMFRILPDAVRLGTRADPPDLQSQLALRICFSHLAAFTAMVLFLTIQLFGSKLRRARA